MLKIYIARHGQDEDNANGRLNGHRDTPLTMLGKRQAWELAQNIRRTDFSFDAVYSSPLVRAYETAVTVTNVLRAKRPNIMDDLIERNFGVMTGEFARYIKSRCAPNIIETATITYFLSPEGAETFPQLVDRASLLLTEIKEKHNDGNVLLVTHGDIGKMIYAAYYGLDWREVLTAFHFGNSELLLLSEDCKPEDACVVKIEQFNH